MIGKLPPDEVEAVLHRRHLGRLSCLAGGRPYVVPVTYAYANGDLYGRTLPGRTSSPSPADPRVWFEVDERDGPAGWCGVVVDGTYEQLDDPAERQAALALLAGAGSATSSTPEVPGAVFRLRLHGKRGCFVRPDPPKERGRP